MITQFPAHIFRHVHTCMLATLICDLCHLLWLESDLFLVASHWCMQYVRTWSGVVKVNVGLKIYCKAFMVLILTHCFLLLHCLHTLYSYTLTDFDIIGSRFINNQFMTYYFINNQLSMNDLHMATPTTSLMWFDTLLLFHAAITTNLCQGACPHHRTTTVSNNHLLWLVCF